MKFLIPLLLLLVSCVTDDYYAQNGTKILHHTRSQFGGTASFNRGDGSSEANDFQTSARDFFSAVTTVAGTIGAVSVNHSNNAVTTTQSNNATNQAINAADNVTKQKAIEAAAEAAAIPK